MSDDRLFWEGIYRCLKSLAALVKKYKLEREPQNEVHHYCVPSYEVTEGVKVKLVSMGITQSPADPTLSPMQKE